MCPPPTLKGGLCFFPPPPSPKICSKSSFSHTVRGHTPTHTQSHSSDYSVALLDEILQKISATSHIPLLHVTHTHYDKSHVYGYTVVYRYRTVYGTSTSNSSSKVFFSEPSPVRRRDLTNVAMETKVLTAYCTLLNGNSNAESANV